MTRKIVDHDLCSHGRINCCWLAYGEEVEGDNEPKTFYLNRNIDDSGVSGTGAVAWGVMFPDGVCALRWNTETASTAIYFSLEDLEHIHGHGGHTEIVWY